MIIAREKKRNNIAEYILYMWQLEDIIRSCKLDIDKVDEVLVQKFQVSDPAKKEVREWYQSLIDMMQEEGIAETGHLQFVKNTIDDLYDLHLRLMKSTEELQYIDAYNQAKPGINDLLEKAKGGASHEIEACFNGLYGLLVLKLQKKEISNSTIEAIGKISKLLATLTQRYHQVDRGELEI